MVESEQTKKRNNLKTKSRVYTGFDDDEFLAPGTERSVLAKYDEDIEPLQKKVFRLGTGDTDSATGRAVQTGGSISDAAMVDKSLLSIDYAKDIETGDYLAEEDVLFKKPKTKRKRPTRRALTEEDPDDTVGNYRIPRTRDLDLNFVDDDELQAALARSRRAKVRKMNKITPEELAAKVIAAERTLDEANTAQEARIDDIAGGLTLNATSEFIRAVQYDPLVVDAVPKEQPHDIPMRPTHEIQEVIEVTIEGEDEEELEFDTIEKVAEETETVTSSQHSHTSGIASTLNILRQQGILTTPTTDQVEREQTQLQRDLWLAEERRRLAQREMEKHQGKGHSRDQATREYHNRLREQQEARDSLEAFKNYKPNINLTQYDEFGREMTSKESYKALSHKFHGKGSGKKKTEKRLKKAADEQKRAAMASGETPLGMNKTFRKLQERSGQAHVVLSVGNRGAVPQAAEYFDSQPLTKGKSEKKLPKESTAAYTLGAQEATGSATMVAQQTVFATKSTNSNNPPQFQPGFSRISTPSASDSADATVITSGHTKVVFGFGTKRKAGEDVSQGSTKRR